MRRAVASAASPVAFALALAGCGDAPPPETCGQPGTICPVAGNGEQDFNGDEHAPEDTAFNLPSVARVGPDGLLYVMDFNNYRLRCVLADGTMDTVAGNGVHAKASAGEAALASPLENPIDVAFAPDGAPTLVAIHDPRVLRIEGGSITAIAGNEEPGDDGDGGPASEAHFQELAALVIAPDGTIFVSDDLSNRVRVIRPDGVIEAYAGSGEEGHAGDGGPALDAALYHPEGLALDGDGNLYIADSYNHRIRRVDAASGVIDTVAGSATRGFSGDGGPAIEAQLQWPRGVAVGPDGSLYIADTFNHRIRRVDADGVISTVAGSTVAGSSKGYAGDGGPAALAQLKGPAYLEATEDRLYIADMQNQVIRALMLPR